MAIKARSIIEIVGGPKEYVDQAMGIVIDKIQHDEKITLLNKKIFEAKQIGDNPLFSSFSEVDIEVRDIADLFGFCFDFLPSSVEIYEPSSLSFKSESVNDMLNELMSKLHQYDIAVKNISAQNILLKRKYGQGDEEKKKE